ncbi:UDP-glucuronosyltransferase [uncultured Cyclobacterium sp.]|uniref:UDP-glucuronosyltransferase n=1 Tax=uncultured Cyclobacterium sp. TaxID=453820 RepID=UPI0030EE9D9E|tara:strand:- start:144551 stop:144922 length:372 start_codon:yes stop_codon:yes gene_type:complete
MNFDYQPKTYFNGTGANALIAKLTYPESQWGEEICIFATTIDGLNYYEIVDFYGNEYSIKPDESSKPLKLQELILLIESMEVAKKGEMGAINQTLLGIPVAESTLYPQLKDYFDQKRNHFGFI